MKFRPSCRRLLAGIAFLLAATTVAAAEHTAPYRRIGVVDLGRIFKEYYKSRIAEETIRRQGETYRQYLEQLKEQLQKLSAEERVARLNSQNIALAPEEQQKAVAAERDAINRVREKRAEIDLYMQSRSDAIRDLEKRKRTEIMNDIFAEIRRRALAEGYDFVFDRSGHTTNDQPALLLAPPDADFTDAVIRELNRTAAAPAKTPSPIPAGPAPVRDPAPSGGAAIIKPGSN